MAVLLAQEVGTTAPLSERLLVAIAGPLVSAVVGTLIIGLAVWFVTDKVQKKREGADRERDAKRVQADKDRENARFDEIRKQDLARADAELEREARERDDALRLQLISDMTREAGSLYLATQHYSRAKRDGDEVLAEPRTKIREMLDARYLASRTMGEVLENRLEAYFEQTTPRDEWHRVMDLLTVRYFQLIDKATNELYEVNAGKDHSGLGVEELRDPQTLLKAYNKALKSAVHSVLKTPLHSRSLPARARRS